MATSQIITAAESPELRKVLEEVVDLFKDRIFEQWFDKQIIDMKKIIESENASTDKSLCTTFMALGILVGRKSIIS